jgi:hypothetical protein
MDRMVLLGNRDHRENLVPKVQQAQKVNVEKWVQRVQQVLLVKLALLVQRDLVVNPGIVK